MLAVKQGDLKAAETLLDANANLQATNVMPDHLCTYVCFMVFTGCILIVSVLAMESVSSISALSAHI